MADQQISQLPEETGTVGAAFPLAIVNTTAAETRKITTANLATAIFSNLSAGGLAASKVAAGYSGASLTDGTVTNAKLVNSSINFGGVSVALGASDTTPAFNLTDATNYPASSLTGTITNAQLAGSIAVSKLASSAVSFGGISVSLGSADATPAFDLTDATNYKTTNLVGTITNAQLAGSIANAKLANSSVSFGGISLALGASDPHPAFDLQDSTGYKTTNLVGTITNAQLAGSIDASKLVADSLTSTQLGANCVGASELANNAVDSGAVQTGAIVNDKIETSSSSTTGIDGATKLRAGSVPASKLDASTVGNGLAINSNVLSINNTITGATSLGLTFSNQGICTGIAALQASDLSGVLATASAVGVVKVPSSGGLSVSGSGDLSLATTVTAHTTRGIAVNAFGQVTSISATVPSANLPVASTTAIGAIKVPSTSSPLTVDGNGILTIGVSGVTAGSGYTKFNVTDKGIVSSAGALAASDIPNISAALLTSGTLDISRIANNAIGGALFSDASTTLFGGPGSTSNIVTFPSASFKGQRFWDEYHGDEYIWTGSSWQAVTITGGELIYGGTYNAASGQNKVASVTTAGAAAGLQTGTGLPSPSATNIRVYVVVSDSGTGTGNAPNVALAPPDMLVSNGTNSWDLVDVSNAIAGQTASNISFTPYGNLASNNAQAVIQELDDEKVGKAGINVITGTLEIGTTGILKFEGSTANAYETTLQNIDPLTADRVLSLPDNTGTLVSTGSSGVVTSAMITDATIVNADISATAAIALSKLAAVSAGQILVGASGTGAITAVTVSGDIALTSAGAFSYVAGSISNEDINGSAGISASKIDVASTSQAGCVQLSSAVTSTSATKAATPLAIKTVNDSLTTTTATADAALPKSGGVLTGHLTLDDEKELRFREEDAGGDHYIALKAAAALAADVTLTLPTNSPSAGFVLKAGSSTPTNLEWAADSVTDSSKMPLAGGTFTNDVTFTGDAINGLWDKSQSAFVANLTGNVTGTASNNAVLTGSTNNTIATVTGANSLAGEANLTFDGTNLKVNSSDGGSHHTIRLNTTTNNAIKDVLHLHSSVDSATAAAGYGVRLNFSGEQSNGNEYTFGGIAGLYVDGSANNGHLAFYTNNSGTNSERMRILNSGNVGIGTADNWAKLVIKTDSSNTSLTGHNYLASQSGIAIENGSTTDGCFNAYTSRVKNAAGTQQSASIAFKSTASGQTPEIHLTQRTGSGTQASALTIDSSQNATFAAGLTVDTNTLHVDATNNRVLIGRTTTNTGYPLCVEGDSNGENILVIGRSADDISEIGFFENDTTTRLGEIQYRQDHVNFRHRVGDICFAAGGSTEMMRIDSSGRLLLGFNASQSIYGSQAAFQVSGTGFATSTISIRRDQDNHLAGGIVFAKSRGSQGGVTVVQSGDSLGSLIFAGADGTDLTSTGAEIEVEVDGTPGSNDIPGRILFKTTADGSAGPTERMRIDSSGNIGIGTTSPNSYANQTTLTINGTDNSRLDLEVAGTLRGSIWANSGGIGIDAGANDIEFYAGSAERLRIATSGAATFSGNVSDGKGNLRSIPANAKSSSYTLIASDAGKCIPNTTGGWTINNNVFSAGDAITFYNNSGSDQTITRGSGTTMYHAADGDTSTTRTLGARGMATLYVLNASEFIISGAGLS